MSNYPCLGTRGASFYLPSTPTPPHIMRAISKTAAHHALLSRELHSLELLIAEKQCSIDFSTGDGHDHLSRRYQRANWFRNQEMKRALVNLGIRREIVSVELIACEADIAYWSSQAPQFPQSMPMGLATQPFVPSSPAFTAPVYHFPIPPSMASNPSTSASAQISNQPMTYVPVPVLRGDIQPAGVSSYVPHRPVAVNQPDPTNVRQPDVFDPTQPVQGPVWHARSPSFVASDVTAQTTLEQPSTASHARYDSAHDTGTQMVCPRPERTANEESQCEKGQVTRAEVPVRKKRNRRAFNHSRKRFLAHLWGQQQGSDRLVRSEAVDDPFVDGDVPVDSFNALLRDFAAQSTGPIGRNEVAYPLPAGYGTVAWAERRQGDSDESGSPGVKAPRAHSLARSPVRGRQSVGLTVAVVGVSPTAVTRRASEAEKEGEIDNEDGASDSSCDSSVEFILGDQTSDTSTWFAARMSVVSRAEGPSSRVASTKTIRETLGSLGADELVDRMVQCTDAMSAREPRRTQSAFELYCGRDDWTERIETDAAGIDGQRQESV